MPHQYCTSHTRLTVAAIKPHAGYCATVRAIGDAIATKNPVSFTQLIGYAVVLSPNALLFLRRQMHHSIIAISLQTFSGNLHTKKREQTRCKTSSSIMYNIPHTRLLPNSICLITSNKHMPVILIVFFAMRTNIGTWNSPPSTIYMH